MKFKQLFTQGQQPTGLFGYNLLRGEYGFKRIGMMFVDGSETQVIHGLQDMD